MVRVGLWLKSYKTLNLEFLLFRQTGGRLTPSVKLRGLNSSIDPLRETPW